MPITSVVHPAFITSINKVIHTIREDGYCNIPQFKDFVEGSDISPEAALNYLYNLGYSHVKTSALDDHTPQEALVDYRPMVAAMLLAYTDGDYATKHPVLDFVKGSYTYATWPAAFPVALRIKLLEDMYAQEGHFFSVSAVADNAILVEPKDEDYIYQRVVRHSHALYELTKSESELTAVWHLGIELFRVANNSNFPLNVHKYWSVKVPILKGSKAYNHFYRLANDLLDKIDKAATAKWVSSHVLKGN